MKNAVLWDVTPCASYNNRRFRERSTSTLRVTVRGELGTMLAIISNRSSLHRNTTVTQRHIPEDGILHSHRRENLKSYELSLLRLSEVIGHRWM
jgi:hypothetical protein